MTTEATFGTVLRTEQLTPHLVRVVLGGEGLAGFAIPEGWTDAYVNLLFLPPDAPYAVPFDVTAARSGHRSTWPIPRRYTVRRWDEAAGELSVDFVTHGDNGTAGPWAERAQPGDVVQFGGPGGDYRPDPDRRTHLMVGDESALPAIAAALEVVPAGAAAYAVLLVDGAADELALDCPGDLKVSWLHRTALPDDGAADALVAAVAELDLDPADLQAFVHGEAVETRAVRRHLLGERGMPRAALSVSPYWRRTFTDEAWREVKRDWQREVEAEI